MNSKKLHKLNLNKANQAKKKLEASADFNKAVFDVRNKHRILTTDSERETTTSKLPENNIRIGSKVISSRRIIQKGSPIYKDLVKILRQFNLDSHYWLDSISNYILYNKFDIFSGIISDSEAEAEPYVIEGKDPLSGVPTTSIRLGKNTTLEDLEYIWPLFTGLPELDIEDQSIKSRFSHRKNLDRDYYIYKLYLATGQKLSNEVLGIIWGKVKLKYKQDLEYQTIKTVVSRMKKEFDK